MWGDHISFRGLNWDQHMQGNWLNLCADHGTGFQEMTENKKVGIQAGTSDVGLVLACIRYLTSIPGGNSKHSNHTKKLKNTHRDDTRS